MTNQDLLNCYNRISPYVHKTPVLQSRLINELVGVEIFFKCENFQKMGAFKFRGATNAVLQLTDEQKQKGVATHSSGNFAQALALAGKNSGVKAFIVMPNNATAVKKEAVKSYGGIVIECEPTLAAREKTTQEIQEKEGATFIHPSNDDNVILGQGTACYELLQDYPNIEFVFTPVGGGGLIAGTALFAHFFGKDCEVIGGEPMEVDDAFRSLQSGKIESNTNTNTIADGLKTQLGDRNFPIIQQYVDHIVRVSEQEIIDAMKLIWERMKIVVEPSSAVALAALLHEKEKYKDKKVGVILSGGNVDVTHLPF